MIHECRLSQLGETWKDLLNSTAGRGERYEKLLERDDMVYYAGTIDVRCPQLQLGFRRGLAKKAGENALAKCTETVIVYDLEEGLPGGMIDMFANTDLPEIAGMLASASQTGSEEVRCSIELPEEE